MQTITSNSETPSVSNKKLPMNIKVRSIIKQAIVYIGGLFMIAVGVNLSKLSNLGIGPVSSVPRACEEIWGFTLGTTTFIFYAFLVLAQVIILRRRFHLRNVFGLVVAVGFSLLVDITGTDPNAFGHLFYHIPAPQTYPTKLVYLAISIVLTSIGVFLYLRPNWIPMPSDGLYYAISETTGLRFGNCKTITDSSYAVIALILQLLFLGGLFSFVGDHVIVREGTVISAIFVGQVVKFLAKRWTQPVEDWLNAGESEGLSR